MCAVESIDKNKKFVQIFYHSFDGEQLLKDNFSGDQFSWDYFSQGPFSGDNFSRGQFFPGTIFPRIPPAVLQSPSVTIFSDLCYITEY